MKTPNEAQDIAMEFVLGDSCADFTPSQFIGLALSALAEFTCRTPGGKLVKDLLVAQLEVLQHAERNEDQKIEARRVMSNVDDLISALAPPPRDFEDWIKGGYKGIPSGVSITNGGERR